MATSITTTGYKHVRTARSANLARARMYLTREILGRTAINGKGERGLLFAAIEALKRILANPESDSIQLQAIDRLTRLLPYVAPTATEELRLVQTQDAINSGAPINFSVYLQDRGFTIAPLLTGAPAHLDTAQEVTCTPVQDPLPYLTYAGDTSTGVDTPA